MPRRIFQPGKIVAYSNYGGALAGYIVQRVSGGPFETYVQRNIFAPLQMTHSTFVQPLPRSLARHMSDGHLRASGSAMPFELPPGPSGGMSTTSDDMAHFMIAQLHQGEYAGARILSPATAELMHAPAFRPIPHLPAMALGFYHEDRNGHIVIGHGGDTVYFHSDLELVLDEDPGYFVSLNSQGENSAADRILAALLRGFMNRYFPGHPPGAPHARLGEARWQIVGG